jgi:hypothetical protein
MNYQDEIYIDDLKDNSELSYYETGQDHVDVYHQGTFMEYVKVYLDDEENDREYICVNNTITYLDTIELLNPEK